MIVAVGGARPGRPSGLRSSVMDTAIGFQASATPQDQAAKEVVRETPSMIAVPSVAKTGWLGAVHWEWGMAVPAMMLITAGVWIFRARRDEMDDERRMRRLKVLAGKEPMSDFWQRVRDWRASLREPTRMVVGVSSMLAGYHFIAWILPPRWAPLSVPSDRWWVVLAVIAIAVIGSLWMDRWQARRIDSGAA